MNKPKILITGTTGFVGARALQHFPNAIPIPSDLTRSGGAKLADFIRSNHPDVILNAAAISDIGTCEKNPDASYAANVLLPVALAHTAKEINAKLISFSSDQVYTGCAHEGPYCESDSFSKPTNLYACHKLEAEQRTLDILPDTVMLRATWMYDMPMYHHANRGNFLINTLYAALHGNKLEASADEYRGITYVRQVAAWIDKAFLLPGGIYNYGSENSLNMFDTTKALLDCLGLDATVEKVSKKRHDLWMGCSKIKKHGICFDTTAEGFRRCIADYCL